MFQQNRYCERLMAYQLRTDETSCLHRSSFRCLKFALLLIAALLALTPTTLAAAPTGKPWAQGRILVQPRAGLVESEFQRILRRAGGRAGGKVRNLEVRIVDVAPQAEEAVVDALSRNPHIKFAELDRLVAPEQTIPDDPNFTSAWHLPAIQAPDAWDYSLGDGVTVAVLDSGVDVFHLDLAANIVPGWNAVSGNTDVTDTTGHGTSVAGVIAAQSNNALGVASVAWHAVIMPVRISNRSDGWAYTSDIASGLTWAADHGARVANISYDVAGSATLHNAAQYMKNRGGVVVVAAGNSGNDPGYAASSTLLAVSATTSSDTLASWSSIGSYVDVAAPGDGIWTTVRGDGYSAVSGTSVASPVAAGVVALIVAANGALSPDEVESVLKSTADDLGDAGTDPLYGAGRVNAAQAVALAAGVSPDDTEPPTVSILSPQDGATLGGLVDVDVLSGDNFGISRVELLVDGSLVGTDTTSPYVFSWDSSRVADGTARLVARAFDAADNQGQSGAVTVTVENTSPGNDDTKPPTVTISSPAADATVSGGVRLSAHASDEGQVVEVRIYVDGALKCAGGTSVSCRWNSGKVNPGSHNITATAKDQAGNTGEKAISVTVVAKSRGGGGRGKPKK